MSKAKKRSLLAASTPFIVAFLFFCHLSYLSFQNKLGTDFEDKEVYEKIAYRAEESTNDTATILLESEASRRRLREISIENAKFKEIKFYILEKNINLEYSPKADSRKIFWGEVRRTNTGKYIIVWSGFHPSTREYLAKKLSAAISRKREELLGLWQVQGKILAIIKSRSGDLRKESISARGTGYRIERDASDLKACTSNTCGNITINEISYPNLAKKYSLEQEN